MKATTVVVVVLAGLAAVLMPQAAARSVVVDQVSSALQESFSALNTKRSEWFENYSTMNNLTEATNTQLKELAMVSKLALPLMWYTYRITSKAQRDNYPKMVEVASPSLPFHVETTSAQSKMGPSYYLEATFLLQNYRDFQVQSLKDEEVIFFLTFNFNDRRAVMGYVHDSLTTEKVVLEGAHFPAIPLNQPFRIHVQVTYDCIIAFFWLTNLDMLIPMPLPEKHIWCTRDYSVGQTYSLDIDTLNGDGRNHQHQDSQGEYEQVSQEEQEQDSHEYQQASQEEYSHGIETSEIKLVSVVVYNGNIY